MTRKPTCQFIISIGVLLIAVGCSQDATGTRPGTDASTGDANAPGDASAPGDAAPMADGSGPIGSEDASLDAESGVDMARLDSGGDAPCTDGICTPQDCMENGWLPPSNLDRDTMPILREETTALTWEAFYGLPFPRGNATFLEIEPDHYVALEFDTNDFDDEGTIIFVNPQAAGPWGSRLVTISQCPGYFGPSPYPADSECREWKFATGNVNYRIGADTDSRFHCDLRADRTYYLNIVPVDEVLPEGSEDLSWRCGIGDSTSDRWDTCGALMEATFVQ